MLQDLTLQPTQRRRYLSTCVYLIGTQYRTTGTAIRRRGDFPIADSDLDSVAKQSNSDCEEPACSVSLTSVYI